MATTAQVPVEVYLMSDYEPDAEYVDGCIEERPMGQYDHSSWQQALQLWFSQHAKLWNIRVRPELRVQTTRFNFRVPDVVVFSRDNPIEQILTLPPIAVFEVLSPEDRMPRMIVKLGEYEKMGIPGIFVVDPEADIISQFLAGDLEKITSEVQQIPGTPCFIDWPKVRELLD